VMRADRLVGDGDRVVFMGKLSVQHQELETGPR